VIHVGKQTLPGDRLWPSTAAERQRTNDSKAFHSSRPMTKVNSALGTSHCWRTDDRSKPGRQFQFAWSNCGRTPCVRCRPAPQDSVRLLWREGTFERRSAYGGCTLKPVVGVAIFWPMVW